MRTFQEFMSKLDAVSESLDDRRDEIDARRKEAIEKQKEKLEDREDRNQLKKEIKSEIKQELSSEAYDAEVMGSSQIRRTGEGGRIGPDRTLPKQQLRRMAAAGGGEQKPVKYKERKDANIQRGSSGPAPGRPAGKDGKSSTNLEPGTAGTKGSAKLSDKERQRKAYAERKARERGEEQPKTASQAISQSQPSKKPVSPDYTPPKASGMTRSERMSQQRKGEAALKDIMKDQEFSRYEKETGQKATGKAKTKLLGRVAQRMAN
jgi:hypothetical protein